MSETPKGQSSVTRRVLVTWNDGTQDSLFLKMLDTTSPWVDLHRKMGVYHAEFGFYRDVPDPGVKVPVCYTAEMQPDTQEFVLLLEDVGPGRACQSLRDVKLAISNLVRLHAHWWNQDVVSEWTWLGSQSRRCLDVLRAFEAQLADTAVTAEMSALLGEATLNELVLFTANPSGWVDYFKSAKQTICHGDFHPGQMFFPTEQHDLVVFDWQSVLQGSGIIDLVFFLSTALSQSQYRSHGRRMIDFYYDSLSRSVHEYGMAEYKSDLAHASLFVLMARLIALMNSGREEAKAEYTAHHVDWHERITYPSLLATDLGGYDVAREITS